MEELVRVNGTPVMGFGDVVRDKKDKKSSNLVNKLS